MKATDAAGPTASLLSLSTARWGQGGCWEGPEHKSFCPPEPWCVTSRPLDVLPNLQVLGTPRVWGFYGGLITWA